MTNKKISYFQDEIIEFSQEDNYWENKIDEVNEIQEERIKFEREEK